MTFELLEEIAFGEMGMLEHEFNESTPLYFVRRLNGQRRAEYGRQKIEMILARKIAYFAAAGNLKEGTTEKDLWLMPWELTTDTERMNLMELAEKIDSLNWGIA